MITHRIGLATLYLADNAEVLPTLARPAALIGDPPYGQKRKKRPPEPAEADPGGRKRRPYGWCPTVERTTLPPW